MKSFKEFYEDTIEEALDLQNIIGKVLSKFKKREQIKNPDLIKKANDAREKIYRVMGKYGTVVRPAKPEYFRKPDESPIYGPDDIIPPREISSKNKQLRKLKTPEQRAQRRQKREEKKSRKDFDYGIGSYHALPFDKKETPFINLARQDAEQIAAHKPIDIDLKELFVLAHEAGHAVQYGELDKNPNQINHDLEYGMKNIHIPQKNMPVLEYLKLIETFANAYMELKAWEKGGKFIPDEFKDDYHNFAKSAYMSYMKKRDWDEYLNQPLIKDLLDKFEHERYTESTKRSGRILEEKFQDIPRSVLGVHNSLRNLPEESPYGFWVDTHGNFIDVKLAGHGDKAREILRKAKEWNMAEVKKSKGAVERIDFGGDPKYLMYGDGWIKTRYSPYDNTIYYTTGIGTKNVSKPQRSFLNTIAQQYNVDIEVDPFKD